MKRKAILYILQAVLLMTTAVVVVFAWLVDSKTTDQIILRSGKVEYILAGDTAKGLVVPGQNLITTKYTITNNSTVDSQLRIKLTIKLGDDELALDDEKIFTTIGLGSDFTLREDKFYYYQDVEGVLLTTYKTPINIIETLILDGVYVQNEYSGQTVKLIITIQAKQADFVDWQTLIDEEINFQTGN